jgi:hypothetical protein
MGGGCYKRRRRLLLGPEAAAPRGPTASAPSAGGRCYTGRRRLLQTLAAAATSPGGGCSKRHRRLLQASAAAATRGGRRRRPLLPKAGDDAPSGHRRCILGPSALLPWDGSSAMLPSEQGVATMHHRRCYHESWHLLQTRIMLLLLQLGASKFSGDGRS